MVEKQIGTKEKIFEAALNLFSENGFHGTTTRKISLLANVNEVTLFRHFKSKAILFKEIIQHVKKTNANINDIAVVTSDSEKALKGIIENVLRLMLKYHREYKMILYGLLDQVEGFEEEIFFDYQITIIGHLTPVVKELQKQKKIQTPVDAAQVARLIISQILGVGNSLLLPKKSIYKGQKIEEITTSITDLYLSNSPR